MKKEKNTIIPQINSGSLLLSQPFWQDEIYKRAAIILINHSKKGSTGIMLNKMSNLSVHDALPELEINSPLYFGGPINKKTISYIHANDNIPDAYYLGNDLFWGGNYEFIQEQYQNGRMSLRGFHFCAGFVQWGTGELEAELKAEKWWVDELKASEILNLKVDDTDYLWSQKLKMRKNIYHMLSPFPDPSLN
jgi:putative transcriptional regulator